MSKIGFIGAGKMAEAMISGLIANGFAGPGEIVVSDISGERLKMVNDVYGVRVTLSNSEVVALAPICVLAVKPQQLGAVLGDLASLISANHLMVSIAAGKSTSYLESLLPTGRVVRVMPNMACLVGAGMNVYTRGSRATAADGVMVANLLGCCGRALEVPELLFDAVTALSGSGPAFFAYLLEQLVEGAVKEGLPREQALILGAQTMVGTAQLLLQKEMSPSDLATAVTSAKGTTAAGREVLETQVMAGILGRTIQAAAQRSRELGKA
ncbi:MAG: pyrroline-5-carboxylate reductase [bacterium]